MPQENQTASARIEARIAPEALLIVKRAAELQGRSVSDFVVDSALNIFYKRRLKKRKLFVLPSRINAQLPTRS